MMTFNRLGRYGRLGNQMFQIASTIGIARANGQDYCFPEWKNWDAIERFGLHKDFEVQKYFRHPLPGYVDQQYSDQFVHWGYHNIRTKKSLNLIGHLQSELYFQHCKDEVRYHFQFDRPAEAKFGCAVHIRRGDYDGDYHPHLDEEYYLPAMERMGASSYTFYSDSPEQIEKYAKYGEIVPRGDQIHDMQDFASHECYIIGNSTWSWWGAWLGGRETIAPRQWFGPNVHLQVHDLIPDRWIRL